MIRGFTALLCENLQLGWALLASRGILLSYPSNDDKQIGQVCPISNLPNVFKHTYLPDGSRVKGGLLVYLMGKTNITHFLQM